MGDSALLLKDFIGLSSTLPVLQSAVFDAFKRFCVFERVSYAIIAQAALHAFHYSLQNLPTCSAMRRHIIRQLVTSIRPVRATRCFVNESLPHERSLYLDSQATSPLDPRVLDVMLPFMTEQYGNPHSRTHAYGWTAEGANEQARQQVASLIGAQAKEVVFTSGATESNNIAVKGVAKFYEKTKGNHIITTQTEHKCVLESCRHLEQVCPQAMPLFTMSRGGCFLHLRRC